MNDAGQIVFADGKVSTLLLPEQEMPGGGRFQNIEAADRSVYKAVSKEDSQGRHAFIATLEDGATGAYLLDADGKISLLLKTGQATNLGTVTHLGRGASSWGIALNGRGQVALSARIENDTPTLRLLGTAAP